MTASSHVSPAALGALDVEPARLYRREGRELRKNPMKEKGPLRVLGLRPLRLSIFLPHAPLIGMVTRIVAELLTNSTIKSRVFPHPASAVA